MSNTGHKKRFRRYHEAGDFHELTFSCYQRRPLLTDARCRILSQQIDNYMPRWGFLLHAFVYMPEHVHLLVSVQQDSCQQTADSPRFDNLLKSIKRLTSVYVKRQMIAEQNPLVADLIIQERPGVQSFRFWQEGPGYDRNLLTAESVSASLDDIHNNPVARGLCKNAADYKWSSASFYTTDGEVHSAELPTLSRLPAELFDGLSST